MTVHTSHKTHDRFATRALDPSLSQSIHNKPKYHLRAGLQYLFYDGSKLTSDRAYAWSGTVEQARHARKRFDAAAGCKIRAVTAIPQHQEEDAL
jgi:hypothetical protein